MPSEFELLLICIWALLLMMGLAAACHITGLAVHNIQQPSPRPPNTNTSALPIIVVTHGFLHSTAHCCICMDAPVGAALTPCGHAHTCLECARRLRLCPLCRAQLTGIQAFITTSPDASDPPQAEPPALEESARGSSAAPTINPTSPRLKRRSSQHAAAPPASPPSAPFSESAPPDCPRSAAD